MTLKPRILARLEWRRSKDNPLEIRSGSGEVVCKTIRWVDGVGHPEVVRKECDGSGQIVIVSKKELGTIVRSRKNDFTKHAGNSGGSRGIKGVSGKCILMETW